MVLNIRLKFLLNPQEGFQKGCIPFAGA